MDDLRHELQPEFQRGMWNLEAETGGVTAAILPAIDSPGQV